MTRQRDLRSPDAEAALAQTGVVLLSQHRGFVRAGIRAGRLVKVLPGVYCAPGYEDDPLVRSQAVCSRYPRGVLIGSAAARLAYDQARQVPRISMALPSEVADRAPFEFTRRNIPSDLITTRHGMRMTVPALTALDLIATEGGSAIDDALRLGAATLTELHAALPGMANRAGVAQARRLLHDSRDQPWSAAERQLHQLLRAHHIRGWRGNYPIVVGERRYVADIAFVQLKLIFEVDGWQFHRDRFESDYERCLALAAHGWMVVRLTWRMLQEPATTMNHIKAVLRGRRKECSN